MSGLLDKLGMGSMEKAKADIENRRKMGKFTKPGDMDKTHQAALKALMGKSAANAKPLSPLDEEAARRSKILGALK